MSDHRQPEVALALSGLAAELHASMAGLGIVSPHGHTDPAWFARDAAFANPAELLIQPDHYVFRMLYSRGVALEALGLGGAAADPRDVFRILAEHWHTFLGTPSHLWMADVLWRCFGIGERLRPENATEIYDRIAARIAGLSLPQATINSARSESISGELAPTAPDNAPPGFTPERKSPSAQLDAVTGSSPVSPTYPPFLRTTPLPQHSKTLTRKIEPVRGRVG